MAWEETLSELAARLGWGDLSFSVDGRSQIQVDGGADYSFPVSEDGQRLLVDTCLGVLPESSQVMSAVAYAGFLKANLVGGPSGLGVFSVDRDGRTCWLSRIFWEVEQNPAVPFEEQLAAFIETADRGRKQVAAGEFVMGGNG